MLRVVCVCVCVCVYIYIYIYIYILYIYKYFTEVLTSKLDPRIAVILLI